jgi:predicted nucleic acid-binding Zn ribbon protein
MPKKPHRHKTTGARPGRPRRIADQLAAKLPPGDVQLAVTQGAAALERTAAWVREMLPPPLASHVTQALERDGGLVVFTESGAWAARLKLALAELEAPLSQRLAPGARVQVRVIPGGRYRR